MHRQILQLAWPMILSNLTVPLLGLVDTAILGHLPNATYLGAVAIGAVIFDMLLWTFGFLRMGTTGMTAQAHGAGDNAKIELIFYQSMLLAIFFGALLLAAQTPLFNLALAYMSAEAQVEQHARIYCEIRILAAPADLCNFVIFGWLLSLGKTRTVLALVIFANLVNLFFDYWLVMEVGMLTDGVAWGSVIASYTLLAAGLVAVRSCLTQISGKSDKKKLWQLKSYSALLGVNRAIFMRTVFLLFTISFFYSQSAQQDEITLAANSILITIMMVFAYGQDGFANAAEILTGRYVGAKNIEEFTKVAKVCSLWFALSAITFTLAIALFETPIITLLTDIPMVIERTRAYWPWLVLLPLVACWNFMFDGIFIGATKGNAMQNTMAFSALLVFLPTWYLSQPLGNNGLWLAFICFHAARSSSMALMYYHYCRKQSWF